VKLDTGARKAPPPKKKAKKKAAKPMRCQLEKPVQDFVELIMDKVYLDYLRISGVNS